MGWDVSNAEIAFGSDVGISSEVVTFTSLANIRSGNASLGNTVSANFFSGSGNNLSNIQASNITGQVANSLIAGTVYTNAQPNITSVGTLASLNVSGTSNLGAIGNVTVTGGTSGQYLTTNGSGTLNWTTPLTTSIVTGTTQAAVKDYRYVLSNVSATTLTLPSSPTLGDTVYLVVANDLLTNIVARNGQNIMSLAQDMTINSSNAAFGLLYTNSTLGWRVI
jgi:hypothetical protein